MAEPEPDKSDDGGRLLGLDAKSWVMIIGAVGMVLMQIVTYVGARMDSAAAKADREVVAAKVATVADKQDEATKAVSAVKDTLDVTTKKLSGNVEEVKDTLDIATRIHDTNIQKLNTKIDKVVTATQKE